MSDSAAISALGSSNAAAVIYRAKQLLGSTAGQFTFTADQIKTFNIKTPCKAHVVLKFNLVSGTLTVRGDVNATGTYAAQDVTSGAISDTSVTFVEADTTSSNKYVAFQLTGGTTGQEAVLENLEVWVLAMHDTADEAVSVRCAFNAVKSGDGTWTAGELDG